MKKAVIMALAAVMCLTAIGQTRGYKCTYEQKMGFSFKGGKDMNDDIAEMINKAFRDMKIYFTLTFADGKSLFEMDKKRSNTPMGDFSNTVYTDMNTQVKISQDNSLGKMFLITDTLEEFNWTITEQTKEINGRLCTKAVLGDTNMSLEHMQGEIKDLENVDFEKVMQGHITAWFSSEIPIPAGPMGYMGLPGLIVQLDMQAMTFTLSDIEAVDDMPQIEPPAKGKQVTGAEFKEIQKKKLKEMQSRGFGGPRGGGPGRVIIMER